MQKTYRIRLGELSLDASVRLKDVGYFILFLLFITPYSLSVGGQGVSANYSFVLLPLFMVLITGRFNKLSLGNSFVLSCFALIFIIASLYQIVYIDYFVRRLLSFIIFFSMFTYMFIKIDSGMVGAFKLAVISYALYSSLASEISYFILGGTELADYAKGLVGSQRIGFIYLIAFWIIFLYEKKGGMAALLKSMFIFILLGGLLLTFSRTSIIGFVGSLLIFFAFKVGKGLVDGRFLISTIYKVFIGVAFIIVVLLGLTYFLPQTFTFFEGRIFNYTSTSENILVDLNDAHSSLGYRWFMLKQVWGYILANPVTGSGYLGVWVLFDDSSGSAHSQYLDVLFRTGFIGFIIYCYLIYKVSKFLFKNDSGLFWGFIGILIYSLFHETFKLSSGGFVLAFLLGMLCQAETLYPRLYNRRAS